jgi:hypothetical protein
MVSRRRVLARCQPQLARDAQTSNARANPNTEQDLNQVTSMRSRLPNLFLYLAAAWCTPPTTLDAAEPPEPLFGGRTVTDWSSALKSSDRNKRQAALAPLGALAQTEPAAVVAVVRAWGDDADLREEAFSLLKLLPAEQLREAAPCFSGTSCPTR